MVHVKIVYEETHKWINSTDYNFKNIITLNKRKNQNNNNKTDTKRTKMQRIDTHVDKFGSCFFFFHVQTKLSVPPFPTSA